MKLLLISDIHSNFEALQEILNHTDCDEILFAGDVVDYGPNPTDVFYILEYLKAKRVLGNHDAAAAFGIDCRSSAATYEASVTTRKRITTQLMPRKALELLGKAEKKLNLEFDGMRIRLLHAAPGDELYRYITKDEASKLEIEDADLLVLGHTHIPYEVRREKTWVVNPGSAGMPKDGDPRASYAVLDTIKRQVEFKRIRYDVDLMLSQLRKLVGDDKQVFEQLAMIFSTGT
ncbi:MAG: metallophosphoesterase family protein [Nitrososphaerota archaeon]|nr:metallophosphoesterase family protein [Nitrososphaerota archaeon]